MRLSEQVITLEQAKRLKELGIHGDTVFQWAGMLTDVNGKWHGFVQLAVTLNSIPAFTVAELGVMLPENFEHEFDFDQYGWVQPKSGIYGLSPEIWFYDELGKRSFGMAYRCANNVNIGIPQGSSIQGDTEAECRAAMLIHLLENKLITPEQVNNSLTSAN